MSSQNRGSQDRPGWLPFGRRGAPPSAAGESEGLAIHADFEGGNVEGVTVVTPAHVRFAARADASPRPLWFYFCIENATVPAIRCDLVNADQCLGPREGWRTARPVFSADGRVWQRLARTAYLEDTEHTGYFSFTVPIVAPRTYVAFSYPYTTATLTHLLRSLPNRQGLQQAELCRTAENRPVPYLRLGNHESPQNTVWVIARQHAGETPASFVVDGMVQLLSRLDPLVLQALSDAAFHLVPMMDVDGVYHGRYGKDEAPVDFNRDWRDRPTRPETAALLKAIVASHGRSPIDLILDLHAPHNGDTACYVFGASESDSPKVYQKQARFLRLLAEEAPTGVGFRESDLRADPPPRHSARAYLGQTFQVPVLTFEISYHLAQSGEYLSPRNYRDFGMALVRALHRFFHEPVSG